MFKAIRTLKRAKARAPSANRRKPLVEKLERFVKFKPQTPLREIIRMTAG
jgi:hypothetical protein